VAAKGRMDRQLFRQLGAGEFAVRHSRAKVRGFIGLSLTGRTQYWLRDGKQ